MNDLFLSRLTLNPLNCHVARDVTDCCLIHKRILQAFPDDPAISAARDQFGVLFRVEPQPQGVHILVQSHHRPDWGKLPPHYLTSVQTKAIGEIFAQLTTDGRYRFRLLANPTKRISTKNTAANVNLQGKRIALIHEDEQLAWLRKKGDVGGFRLTHLTRSPGVPETQTRTAALLTGRYQSGKNVTIKTVLFEGILHITNGESFQEMLRHGIGSGKAYGCGLVSIARV